MPHSRHEKSKFRDKDRSLDHVLSQQTLLFGSAVDQNQSESKDAKSRVLEMLQSDTKTSRKAPVIKPNVLTDNIFNEKEKQQAKRIFMNRLTDYLEN